METSGAPEFKYSDGWMNTFGNIVHNSIVIPLHWNYRAKAKHFQAWQCPYKESMVHKDMVCQGQCGRTSGMQSPDFCFTKHICLKKTGMPTTWQASLTSNSTLVADEQILTATVQNIVKSIQDEAYVR